MVSRATRLAGKTHCTRFARGASFGPVLVKRRNKANDRFTPRPEGASQVTWHRVAALEKGMPFTADCALFQVTWDALYPSILGCSTTVYMSTFDAGIEQIRGELNSYAKTCLEVSNYHRSIQR